MVTHLAECGLYQEFLLVVDLTQQFYWFSSYKVPWMSVLLQEPTQSKILHLYEEVV